jgi:hypothetical protein
MTYKKEPKNSIIYTCEKCDYKSNKKSQWEKHLQTKKHNTYTILTKKFHICDCGKQYNHRQSLNNHKNKCKYTKNLNDSKNVAFVGYKNATYEKCPFLCDICGKQYKHHSSYYRHKSSCNTNIITKENDNIYWKEMFIEFMKKNTEILDEVKEYTKEPKIINYNTINNTTNNTQFNIMNYLNNDCKDAMNLSDFINELPFSLNDLEIMGTKGYQESIEDTFIKQLRIMDKTKRPIHCSDKKRKSFYIKENNIWEKDEHNKKLVNCFIKLSQKHKNMITIWTHYNKNWSFNERKQDFFNKSVQEVAKYNDNKQINKIINKLTFFSIK